MSTAPPSPRSPRFCAPLGVLKSSETEQSAYDKMYTMPMPNEVIDSQGWMNTPKKTSKAREVDNSPAGKERRNRAAKNWRKASALAVQAARAGDPWGEFEMEALDEERALRHSYDPQTNTWKCNMERIKMERTPFARGAFRACYRTKKWSNFVSKPSWTSASNYVAKQYLSKELTVEKGKEYAMTDCKLQLIAKEYGEHFDRLNPPKKVDFLHCFVMEMVDRKDRPFMLFERFISGKYEKYNTNAGYILTEDNHQRNTPQAFSHFTFQHSNGRTMIVDVQGVSDLYTDPAAHSTEHDDFGDSNLGINGFALFFYTHHCSALCRQLGLRPVEHAEEVNDIDFSASDSETVSAAYMEQELQKAAEGFNAQTEAGRLARARKGIDALVVLADSAPPDHALAEEMRALLAGVRDVMGRWEGKATRGKREVKAPPRVIPAEVPLEATVMGHVYFRMAELCERGAADQEPNLKAALFYTHLAAQQGVLLAILTLANGYADLPHDFLRDAYIAMSEKDATVFVLLAAERNSLVGAIKAAKMYELGQGVPADGAKAVEWYKKAAELKGSRAEAVVEADDASGSYELTIPDFEIVASGAAICAKGAAGAPVDRAGAAEAYRQASDLAFAAFKERRAMAFLNLADKYDS